MSLISYAYFRDFNNVSQNVDDNTIKPFIFQAEQELKFLIGKEFYDQLETQYNAADGTTGFSADNLAFYDPYLIQWIAKSAYVDLLQNGNYQVTRTGLRVLSDDASSLGSDKLIGEVIKAQRQRAEQFKGRMIAFLSGEQRRDSSKYPLYDDSCNANKFGASFHITSVSKEEDVYVKIQNQINNNGA